MTTTEARYVVLRCARCRLINPYQRRECARCGESRRLIVSAAREEVLNSALEFAVAPEQITAPRPVLDGAAGAERGMNGVLASLSAWADALVARLQRAAGRERVGLAGVRPRR